MKKKYNWDKILFNLVLVSLIISIFFIILRLIFQPKDFADNIQTDYTLMLVQCILGIVCMMIPSIVKRKWNITIPSNMMIAYVVFLYCAIVLGEVRNFYYNIKNWDTILHTLSGAMLGSLGFSIISLLNKSESVPMELSPLFIAIFAFCFAVSLGCLWEIYEFTFDGILGLNMQKFMLEDGTQLVGRLALKDTMKDLIVDCIGAFAASFGGYISMKVQDKWIQNVQLKKDEDR